MIQHSDLRSAYVVGAGGHAKVVVRMLQQIGYQVEAIFDDCADKWETRICDVPVVGAVDEIESYPAAPAVLAIGNNAVRRELARRLQCEWLTLVHPSAVLDATVKIGHGTVIFANAVVQPDAVLGEHVILNTAASVDHDCSIGDYVHVAPGACLAGGVEIGEGSFVGAGAVVIQYQRIGQWTTVGAGGVVVRDLPSRTTAVGIPARVRRPAPPTSPQPATPAAVASAEQNGDVMPDNSSRSEVSQAMPRVYLSPPHMSHHERELLLEAFDSNWIAPLGPHVDAFEREFAATVGAAHAVAISSGTAALHLALMLRGVGPGDRVATSSLTFAASANAIRYVGATPVFIDSEWRSWNMDPELLAEELEAGVRNGRPIKAVLTVDVLGQCADYDAIQKVCRFYDVPLIEDAAESLGANYRGQSAGTFGDIGCFSFNGNKIITTSGGGMLVTDRKEWADRARFLATQARDPAPHYEHSEVGYNYRMSNLLAAVGRGQLRVLDERVESRRENFAAYCRALGDLPGISFMPELVDGVSTRWLSCILVDPAEFGAKREDLRVALEEKNVESRPVWKPMHLQPAYADCPVRGGAVSEEIFRNGLCLPSGSNLSDADRSRVVEIVRAVHRTGVRQTEAAEAKMA